jgi:hypothetical protein
MSETPKYFYRRGTLGLSRKVSIILLSFACIHFYSFNVNAGFISWMTSCWTTACEVSREAAEQRAKYLELHKIGTDSQYQYSHEQLIKDTKSGFDIILVVDTSENSEFGQKAQLYVDGELVKIYNVSTGLEKKKYNQHRHTYMQTNTVKGRFLLQAMIINYTSGTWGDKMPYSIFFHAGWALHGVSSEKQKSQIGHRASAGCVRFYLEDIKEIFNLFSENREKVLIIVQDSSQK